MDSFWKRALNLIVSYTIVDSPVHNGMTSITVLVSCAVPTQSGCSLCVITISMVSCATQLNVPLGALCSHLMRHDLK